MATVKVKFRPSAIDYREGTLYFQVIHNRVVRQIKTGHHISANEWNSRQSEIVMPDSDEDRRIYLSGIRQQIQMDTHRLRLIVSSLEHDDDTYTADDVVSAFVSHATQSSLFEFMDEVIVSLRKLGRVRTAETYATTQRSFRRFMDGKDVLMDRIDDDMMCAYEAWLKTNGVSRNSSAFYMRNLRAVYNRAVEKGLTPQQTPFKHVHSRVEKTLKRAVSLKVIRQIRDMDLSHSPAADFARNMFLFSFYTRGMSFVDISYLRKKDLSGGVLSYRRRKTGQQLFIKWEKPMQEIVERYDTSDTIYLLPIIRNTGMEERKQYLYAGHNINRWLKDIGSKLGLPMPLTMYVARHAWASIAKSKNIPLSVISEGMGHDSEATTRIYLASLDNMAIDKANRIILKSL